MPRPTQILSDSLGTARVRWVAPRVVRITHAPAGSAYFPADRPWLEHVLLPQPEMEGKPGLQVNISGGCLSVAAPGGEVMREADPVQHLPKGKLRITLHLETGEAIYGLGEWFNAFRRTQGKAHLHIRDAVSLVQGVLTYSGIPVFYSSRGYALWLLNSYPSTFTLDPANGKLVIDVEGGTADYMLIHGPAFKDILRAYTTLTGRPPLLPRWAFGLWVTSYPQGPQSGVLAHVAEHRTRSLPLDAVILDYHWEERFHNFRWRKALIPDPDQLIRELKSQGMRLGLIFTPFVNNGNHLLMKLMIQMWKMDKPSGMATADDRALPEYEEGLRGKLFAHPNTTWWMGSGGMMDFTNPAAAAWWNAKLRPLLLQGVDFFKNDDGEYLPLDGRASIGMDGREYHNIYGFYYGRAIYNGMSQVDNRRPLIYARSVWAGSQRYPALFLGDQKPTFEGLEHTMRAGLNLSLLGFAYWTADIFGLDGKTTFETHMRYTQWAMLVPVARYFWRPPHLDGTRFPWSYGKASEDNFRQYSELRYRLLPYYYTLGHVAQQTGMPLIRPLVLEFEGDPRLDGITDQVMLGDVLMLAPVVQNEARSRKIVLPAGIWHDFWTQQTWKGPAEILYDAPLERLPLLVRGGSLLPMGPVLQHIPDGHQFDQLEIHAWPPYPAQGEVYDDDGLTRAYQQGECAVARFAVEPEGVGIRVRCLPVEGRFTGQSATRKVMFVLHGCPQPRRVTKAGKRFTAWSYDAAESTLHIKLSAPLEQGVEVLVELAE